MWRLSIHAWTAALLLSVLLRPVACRSSQSGLAGNDHVAPTECREGMVVHQVGEPRSASTFQFQLACLVVRVCALRENRTDVNCYRGYDLHAEPYGSVRKRHGVKSFSPDPSDNIFRSYKDYHDDSGPADYVAFLPNMEKRGFATDVRSVGELFGFTEEEHQLLHHYMAHWSILRQCCGTQSSYDHRMQMHNVKNFKSHHSPFSQTAPRCEIYNMDNVEHTLLSNPLASNFKNCVSSGADSGDPIIAPGFCRRSDERLRDGYDFNGKPFKEKAP